MAAVRVTDREAQGYDTKAAALHAADATDAAARR
jgi:hypothetical protein